jgi:hypothetical protein
MLWLIGLSSSGSARFGGEQFFHVKATYLQQASPVPSLLHRIAIKKQLLFNREGKSSVSS